MFVYVCMQTVSTYMADNQVVTLVDNSLSQSVIQLRR